MREASALTVIVWSAVANGQRHIDTSRLVDGKLDPLAHERFEGGRSHGKVIDAGREIAEICIRRRHSFGNPAGLRNFRLPV